MHGSSSRRIASTRDPGSLRILDREPGKFAFSAWQNVTIFVWQQSGSIDGVRRLAKVTDPIYAEYPEGVSNVHVVGAGVRLPENDVRDELSKLMRTRAEQRACIGFVLEGGGFWASAVRSLIVGMRVLAPRTFDLEIVGSVDDVARWLPTPHFKKTGRHVDANAIKEAIEETRTRVANLEPPKVASFGE